MKTLSKAVAVASLLSAGIMSAQVANAEVEYSAELATSYLFRGQDQEASGLISAAADYSHDSGAYAGLWVAGAGATPEYDLYAGFALDAGDVSVDVGAVTYVYPGSTTEDAAENTIDGDVAPFDGVEAYVNVGFMGASLSYNVGLESLEDSTYIALGYEVAGVSLTYGIVDNGLSDKAATATTVATTEDKYTHIDVSYSLTDELGITVSKTMDDSSAASVAAENNANEDLQVVMTYSLAFK